MIGNILLSQRLVVTDEFDSNFSETAALTLPTTSLTGRESLYEERRRSVIEGCKKLNRSVENNRALNGNNILYDVKHWIYYCPITKVGSTFWKRVLTVIGSQGRLKSPFEISLGQVKFSKSVKLSKSEYRNFNQKGTSFMFVRNPYARIFSGYENKIYHSNLMFWKSVGRHVVRLVRGTSEKIYKKYGFDVTFSEFIKYILFLNESGERVDGHFSPMINHCDPCSTHFQYIGKLETMTDDAIYLISKWRTEFNDFNLYFNDFEKETALDTARGHIRFLFQTKKVLAEIEFPFIKLMIRTWRDLQIRGYLSKHIEFPYNDTDVHNITQSDYLEAIREALAIPVNSTEVRQQRNEALIQAYRQVPLKDMEKLRRYLLQDCTLFGYDDRPLSLFDRSKPVMESFLYLDGLKRD